MHWILPRCSFTLAVFLLFTCCLRAQPGYRQIDAVTFSDGRRVYAADIGRREVYFATTGGVYRLSRFANDPLDPWYNGVGLEKPINLTDGRIILWHEYSGTLWLATQNSLKYYHAGFDRWYSFNQQLSDRIMSLGETKDYIVVDFGGYFRIIDPLTLQLGNSFHEEPAGVRWRGKRAQNTTDFYPYQPVDRSLNFYRRQNGLIVDGDFNRFEPVADIIDEEYQLHYICYPGLGIGVADTRNMELEVIQPGPTGMRIMAIELVEDDLMWVVGIRHTKQGGLNLYDRTTGRWQRYDQNLIFGLDSHNARDAVYFNGRIYFATDAGVIYYSPRNSRWKTIDLFDGLHSDNLLDLSIADGYLVIGSDNGVNLMTLPDGPVFDSGDKVLDELRTGDIVSDGDTVWAGGIQGLFRRNPTGRWQTVSGGAVIGDEPVNCLTVTTDRLWIGSMSGIRELNRLTGQWTEHLGKVFLGNKSPTAMVANDSLLWVGTTGNLFVFNRFRGLWLEYGEDQGFPWGINGDVVRINDLELEADSLWIGSSQGLTRFIWNRPGRDGL